MTLEVFWSLGKDDLIFQVKLIFLEIKVLCIKKIFLIAVENKFVK